MKFTINIFLILFLISCSNQVYLEDGNFNLEKTNLSSFNSKEFYAKSSKAEWTEYHKKRKSNVTPIYFFQTDIDTIDNNGNDFQIDNPYGIVYRQSGVGGANTWEKDYCIAQYNTLKFEELNALTDLKNKSILLCAYTEQAEKIEIENTIKKLNNKYGNFTISESSAGFTNSKVKKWDTGDVIISLISDVEIDFKNVVLTKKEKKEVLEIESKKLNSVYLFFCRKEYYEQIKEMKTRIGFMSSFED